jgi:hypothetical protein
MLGGWRMYVSPVSVPIARKFEETVEVMHVTTLGRSILVDSISGKALHLSTTSLMP